MNDHFADVIKSLGLFLITVLRVFYLPTPWSRVLLEKLVVAQPHSQEPTTEPYAEPNKIVCIPVEACIKQP
jgi:hypothetical protein